MLRTAWRSLLAHRLRLLLSAAAVVIGVAFVAGTFVFTDTLKKTFDDLFTATASDVVVKPTVKVEDFDTGAATLPAALLDTVRSVDAVASAMGRVLVNGVQVVADDGTVVGASGAPNFGANWSDNASVSPYRLVSGRGPTRPGEVAVDAQTAQLAGLAVGERADLLTPRSRMRPVVVGIFRFGSSGNLVGASLTAFDTATAQRILLGGRDAYTSIEISAQQGVSPTSLSEQVRAVVPASLTVLTGQQAAADDASEVATALGFINIFLLVFAFIALFVGTFIIVNTFTMLVAQRTREFALLRAIGASRGQVVGTLLLEAAFVGLVGATVGLVAGIGLAVGLQKLFTMFGLDVPSSGLVLLPRTVIVSYVVGITVTVLAALVPSWRASRIPPVVALRDDVSVPQRSLRTRWIVGCVLALLGMVALPAGFAATGSFAAALVGVGALLVFLGVAVMSPAISRPVVAVLGAPVRRLYGTVGRLAVENAQRNPRRTAATASALMVGLALVTAMSVLGSSTAASTDRLIDDTFGADFVVQQDGFTGFSPTVATVLARVPGVGTVSRYRVVPARVDGRGADITGVDPDSVVSAFKVTVVSGSIADLVDGTIAIDDEGATAQRLAVGDSVRVVLATGPLDLTVAATYRKTPGFSGWLMANDALVAAGIPATDVGVYVTAKPGVDPASLRPGLQATIAAYPNLSLLDQSQLKQEIRDQIGQLLVLIYALLALAILVAALGIVNTLALSVIERTREIGLLRAVGTVRSQIRRMIRLESLVIAAYGAVLGVLLGLGFGIALQQAIKAQGITDLSVPWRELIAFVVVAVVLGILAALWPAFRAGRLDVLTAVTTE